MFSLNTDEQAAETGRLEIREMTDKEVDEVCRLEEETFSMPWKKKDFLEMIENDHMCYLVVLKDERVIAGAGIREIVGDIEITNVAVKKDFRNRGIGTMLINAVIDKGHEMGGGDFTLEVRAGNEAAIALYEKAGFKTEGVRKDFYERPVEDGLIMWKRGNGSL
ncbi:MAG: ribosomal protein S18-alanine N-acetyltransferase [Lachnospiraceae bacterium]|nr:ribosomal protein S18-alanine N-acetyltransferase [Lachnospiraceae bacterium]